MFGRRRGVPFLLLLVSRLLVFFFLLQIPFHFPDHCITFASTDLVAGDQFFIYQSFKPIHRILWPVRNLPSFREMKFSPIIPHHKLHLLRIKALHPPLGLLLVDGLAAEQKMLILSTSLFSRRFKDPVSGLGRTVSREMERKKLSWAWPSFFSTRANCFLRASWASSPLNYTKALGFQVNIFSLCFPAIYWIFSTTHHVRLLDWTSYSPELTRERVLVELSPRDLNRVLLLTPADHRIYRFATSAVLVLKMVAKGLVRLHHSILFSISRLLTWTRFSCPLIPDPFSDIARYFALIGRGRLLSVMTGSLGGLWNIRCQFLVHSDCRMAWSKNLGDRWFGGFNEMCSIYCGWLSRHRVLCLDRFQDRPNSSPLIQLSSCRGQERSLSSSSFVKERTFLMLRPSKRGTPLSTFMSNLYSKSPFRSTTLMSVDDNNLKIVSIMHLCVIGCSNNSPDGSSKSNFIKFVSLSLAFTSCNVCHAGMSVYGSIFCKRIIA